MIGIYSPWCKTIPKIIINVAVKEGEYIRFLYSIIDLGNFAVIPFQWCCQHFCHNPLDHTDISYSFKQKCERMKMNTKGICRLSRLISYIIFKNFLRIVDRIVVIVVDASPFYYIVRTKSTDSKGLLPLSLFFFCIIFYFYFKKNLSELSCLYSFHTHGLSSSTTRIYK